MTPRHIEISLEEGVNEVLDQFGYKSVYPNMVSGPHVTLDVKKYEKGLPSLPLHCINPEDFVEIKKLCNLTNSHYGKVDSRIFVVSTNKSLHNEIMQQVERSEFQSLCIAGNKINEKF